MSQQPEIPDKLYFRIGEVAKLIGVEPYVLRYWETEFPEIAPVKSKSRQRLYKRCDVELIFKIRDLLYDQKFTIKGAKKVIKKVKKEIGHDDDQFLLNLEGDPAELKAKVQRQRQRLLAIVEEMSDFISR
ncbi:MAG: MerR family transcriptional regulator [Deltaproteobacteria bacterium]|nr:MerR family transcriptional regulator [Deltaproteobacteria bacterium]